MDQLIFLLVLYKTYVYVNTHAKILYLSFVLIIVLQYDINLYFLHDK